MKIGLVTPSWPGNANPNGITTAVKFLVEGLEELGHETTVIPLRPETDPHTHKCVALPAPRKHRFVEKVLKKLNFSDPYTKIYAESIAAAAQIAVDRHGIEVLIMEETQGWAGIVQNQISIPVIVTLHGPWFILHALQVQKNKVKDRRRILREAKAFRSCAGISSPSRNVLEKTKREVPRLACPQVVIPNSIHLKPPVSLEGMSDVQKRSILFVGRFDYLKGADILLTSFADLVTREQDIFLTFVGPDKGIRNESRSVSYINDMLQALGPAVSKRITYKGSCRKSEIDELRRQHFITIIASRYETFSYTLLEALASGSPTICTDAGGPSEILRDGETGILVPVGDATAISAAARQFLGDPDSAMQMGARAREDVDSRFSPRRIAEDWVELCRTVIENHEKAKAIRRHL